MKKIILSAFLTATTPLMAQDLKVLMIGNSFSLPVLRHLPKIVRESKAGKIYVTSAFIGGCSFRQHYENIIKAQEDPNFSGYQIQSGNSADLRQSNKRTGNVLQLLKERKWDIITIQQASHESWNFDRYQPYADDLIKVIREHAPQAEIVIQQTWSYRNDDSRIKTPGGSWKFDQTGMFERIEKSYNSLAEKHSFRQIPVGQAVQLFRERTPVKYVPISELDLAKYKSPNKPKMDGDVVGIYYWRREDGKQVLRGDSIHLNPAGEYLQGCVWFLELFGNDISKIKYVPNFLTQPEAKMLQECASDAVKSRSK